MREKRKTGAVIVAAGMSANNSDIKEQIKHGAISMAERVILNFKRAGIKEIVMVTGFQAKQIEKSLQHCGVTFLRNDQFETTQMLNSAKMGLAFMKERCDQVLFCPVDVPFFSTDTVGKILEAEGKIVYPICQGQMGHPIRLDSTLIDTILEYNGGGGLKGAMESLKLPAVGLVLEDEGAITDADSHTDYQHLVELHDAGLMRPEINLCLSNKQPFLDASGVVLLKLIDSLGSVKEACEKAGISYSKGWTILHIAERELGYPVTERQPGGKNGGMTFVTERGKKLMELYERYERKLTEAAQLLYEEIFEGSGLW